MCEELLVNMSPMPLYQLFCQHDYFKNDTHITPVCLGLGWGQFTVLTYIHVSREDLTHFYIELNHSDPCKSE